MKQEKERTEVEERREKRMRREKYDFIFITQCTMDRPFYRLQS